MKSRLRVILSAIVLLCSCRSIAEGSATPTATPDATMFIPDSAHLLHQVTADLDADGKLEHIIMAGFGGSPQQLGFDWLQLFVVRPDREPDDAVAFQSEPLAGDRAEALSLVDLDGHGAKAVVSVQSMGATGETLYVLAWHDGAFAFLRPHGGRFGGLNRYGETGVRIVDPHGNGALQLQAYYGPAASRCDVYCWDGNELSFVRTPCRP